MFLILVALALYPITTFAINFNPASVKGVAQAYGFILGQEYSLSRIETDFPEMATRVELWFFLRFPDRMPPDAKNLFSKIQNVACTDDYTLFLDLISSTYASQESALRRMLNLPN